MHNSKRVMKELLRKRAEWAAGTSPKSKLRAVKSRPRTGAQQACGPGQPRWAPGAYRAAGLPAIPVVWL